MCARESEHTQQERGQSRENGTGEGGGGGSRVQTAMGTRQGMYVDIKKDKEGQWAAKGISMELLRSQSGNSLSTVGW